MALFDVYKLQPITPVKASGSWLWDEKGQRYLDFYGGHAVISIGHNHPHWVDALQQQLSRISFYSNSIQNPLQEALAERLAKQSGYPDYSLFLCNSGAEANENALKIASFITGKAGVVAFNKSFHGRTSAAVAATDNPKIVAPVNAGHQVRFLPWNDISALDAGLDESIGAVIIEGIQGVGGIHEPDASFLQELERLCQQRNILLILDEVQSGCGRTGQFFAHQWAGIRPPLITMAKGMGNGFPVGGVLISPDIAAWSGMLGTTFGGNYLACAAALAVLEVLEQENLLENALQQEQVIRQMLADFPGISPVRGRGLMLGFEAPEHLPLKKLLLEQYHIFTGEAGLRTLRLLPSLAIGAEETSYLAEALQQLSKEVVE
ncbi:MAG: aspartate aminotransferase family protein [Sphingobacteriaceae bacterium]|nr:aspartate aminotransferase family protein [Sphingobacteriaceae bacterium]